MRFKVGVLFQCMLMLPLCCHHCLGSEELVSLSSACVITGSRLQELKNLLVYSDKAQPKLLSELFGGNLENLQHSQVSVILIPSYGKDDVLTAYAWFGSKTRVDFQVSNRAYYFLRYFVDQNWDRDRFTMEIKRHLDPTKTFDLPDSYEHNGLKNTLNTVLKYQIASREKVPEKQVKLRVGNSSQQLKFIYVNNPDPSDLVVILPGLGSDNEREFDRFWRIWLTDLSCHLVSFPSSFSPDFLKANPYGAPGYIPREADATWKAIKAFTDWAKSQDSGRDGFSGINRIHIFGVSYGGLVAIEMGKRYSEIDKVVALSPPMDLRKSARMLDDFQRDAYYVRYHDKIQSIAMEWRDQHSLGTGTVQDDRMRAIMTWWFRQSLEDLIRFKGIPEFRVDEELKAKNLTKADMKFEDYLERSKKWWTEADKSLTSDELVSFERAWSVVDILHGYRLPGKVHIVIARDDPWSSYFDWDRFPEDLVNRFGISNIWDGKTAQEAGITLMPHGGHMGFARDPVITDKLREFLMSK